MTPLHDKRIRELLEYLAALDARIAGPEDAAILEIARDAIVDELGRLAKADGLAVYRRGNTLEAVSMVG